jgi:hypothetical protein
VRSGCIVKFGFKRRSEQGSNSVAQALAAQDSQALGAALREQDVALLVAEAAGQQVPAILTDSAGIRAIAVLSGSEAAQRFGGPAVATVRGDRVAEIAHRQGVDAVLFDPAGPAPVRFAPGALQAMIDGIVAGSDGQAVLVGDLEVLPARSAEADRVRDFLARRTGEEIETFVFDRLVARRFVLTVGVQGSDDSVRAVVEGLSREPDVGMVDVVQLDDETSRLLAGKLPGSKGTM